MLAGAALIAAGHVHAQAVSETELAAQFTQRWPDLRALYEDIHAHPETAFRETRTAALLAGRMRALGFTVTEGVGRTGIVAVYRNGEGPTLLVRTELDGLAMEEKTGLPYASRYQETVDGHAQFTAHSCGHDAHMAAWIGTAGSLLALKDRWHGTLVFIGQPAEEGIGGAEAMVSDGLLTRFPRPDFGLAVHVSPLPAGTVTLKEGAATSSADSLQIVFHGRGGHGSMPSSTIDPIVIGAHFVSDVQTVVSREKDAGTFGVVTVGAFNAGTVGNIIPDTATLRLTLRSYAPEVRQLLRDGVERTARASAMMANAPAPDIVSMGGTGAVMNDIALARRLDAALRPVLGDRLTLVPASAPGSPASEDFSVFIENGVPSVQIGVGGVTEEMRADYRSRGMAPPSNHSPLFHPDPESTIRTSMTALTLGALAILGEAPATP